MIVRRTKQIPVSYLFSVAGAVVFAMVAMTYARAVMVPTPVATCDERYQRGVRFAWARQNGEALTPDELQGKLGGRDWGLNENVRMLKVPDAPAPVVLEIALRSPAPANSDARDAGRDTGRSGMGFVWQPKLADRATAGCLSYSVWVPPEFDYGTGGVLPGVFGDELQTEPTADAGSKKLKRFSTRLHWRNDGSFELVATTQDWDRGAIMPMDNLKLPHGRWIRIEQELALNDPGQANGTLRVWIDGAIGIDRSDVVFRGDLTQTLSGIAADIHFVDASRSWTPVAKSTRMLLSPLELRLK